MCLESSSFDLVSHDLWIRFGFSFFDGSPRVAVDRRNSPDLKFLHSMLAIHSTLETWVPFSKPLSSCFYFMNCPTAQCCVVAPGEQQAASGAESGNGSRMSAKLAGYCAVIRVDDKNQVVRSGDGNKLTI